ncbi:MAG: DUF11 domain-containing protein [Clostridia bacterium]|nr:DUF11 domain-containing protein [Clostridia bacterium]
MKVKQKLIAILMTTIMLGSNLLMLGNQVIAVADELQMQNSKTTHANIEFNSYLETNTHKQTYSIKDGGKIYIELAVKESGYLKNGIVELKNSNYEIDESKIDTTSIEKIQNGKIYLKQISYGQNVLIELPITLKRRDKIEKDMFSKISEVSFNGTYVEGNGKEKVIEKTIQNEISWSTQPEIELTGDITKYLPYQVGETYGLMIQAKINSSIKEVVLPISSTNLEILAPTIKMQKPQKVTVVANSTKATNGSQNEAAFTKQNYQYDEQTGKVILQTQNNPDVQGNIAWMEGKDEYLVSFFYEGKEIYDNALENLNKTQKEQLNIPIKANMQVYGVEENVEIEGMLPYIIEEQKGELVDFAFDSTKEVSKGYLYANYVKDTKQETTYNLNYEAQIYHEDSARYIEIKEAETKIEATRQIIVGNNSITKNIKIEEAVFHKILGEEGSIQITDTQGNVLGQINKETPKDEEGNLFLDLTDKKVNTIHIKTTKPVQEGKIQIKVQKAFTSTQTISEEQMKEATKIIVGAEQKTNIQSKNFTKEITMKEPVSKAQISIEDEKALSTVLLNENVNIRVVLDNSSLDCALYKNPSLRIELPTYISKVELKNTNLLMNNGLEIKETKIVKEEGKQVIYVTLEGTQTQYAIGAEYKGTILLLNTNIEVEALTPSNESEIIMTYTNENEKEENYQGQAKTKAKFVAPTGIVAANGITGYSKNKSGILSISSQNVEATVETYADKKIATVLGKVMNNYENKIANVVILGRLPAQNNKAIDSNEELGSNFTAPLKSEIKITGITQEKYTIYYSIKEDASKDLEDTENGWSTTRDENAKSYLIVTNNYEIEPGEKIDFEYEVEIPKDLSYNSSSYAMYKVYYDNVSTVGTIAETKTSPIVKIATGQGPELDVKIAPNVETIKEGQIVKMKVTVQNTGEIAINNAKINIPKPEYTNFANFYAGVGFEEDKEIDQKTIKLGSLEPGETKNTYYYLKIDDNTTSFSVADPENVTEEEEKKIEEAQKFPKTITHKVTITADEIQNGEIPSNEYTMSIQKGAISIKMVGNIAEEAVLHEGQEVTYNIYLFNISREESLRNVVVSIPLGNALSYISASMKDSFTDTNETTTGITYNEQTNSVQIAIDTFTTTKFITLNLKVKKLDENFSIMATATAEGKEEQYSNKAEYTAEKIKIEVSELTSSPKYIPEKEEVTYKFNITNKGNSTVYGIKVTDTLPQGITFKEVVITRDGKQDKVTNMIKGEVVASITALQPEETAQVEIKAKADLLEDKNEKTIQNKANVVVGTLETIETNTVTNIIEYNEDAHKQPIKDPESSRYKISGTAWIDENQNGKRDEDEKLLSNVPVMLINKKDNSIVKDPTSNQEKRTTTTSKGTYQFTNIPKGEYLVIFLYDASKYSLTTYQAKEVSEELNSDAIDISIVLDGKKQIAGITDVIKITNTNVRDIDIGVYVAEKFDLKLDKYITKITRTTPTAGTKVFNYNNSKLQKIEVLDRNIGKSSIIVEYKIVVTNEGKIPGYARKIVDYLPQDARFNTEINKDWYLSEGSQNVYNASLADTILMPGESKELTLVLSFNITNKNIGQTLNNNAEIYESYNEQGLDDMDSIPGNKVADEDDISHADIVLAVVTGGQIILYATLTLIIITAIGFGIYEIKKRVLTKN